MLRFQSGGLFQTRRDFLTRLGMGFGAVACTQLLETTAAADASPALPSGPLSPKAPPLPAKVKRVVHFFLNGGPSHLDTFDPKPALAKYAGKPLPTGHLPTERKTGGAFPSPFKFARRGQSGLEIRVLVRPPGDHSRAGGSSSASAILG